MANNIDPWQLLREAREFILRFGKTEEDHNLRDRIDAALAARKSGINCGKGCPDCGHPYGGLEYCQGEGHNDN